MSDDDKIAKISDWRPTDIVTEESAALEFAERHKCTLRFDHSAGRWLYFDGAAWRPDHRQLALAWARAQVRALAERKSETARFVMGRLSFARSVEIAARADQRLSASAEVWDRDPYLLATPKATINLRTGDWMEPDPDHLITKLAGVAPSLDYGPGDVATHGRWLNFIMQTFGDSEMMRYVQRICGYALTGDTSEHAMFLLVGSGGNGKSTLLNVLRFILGDYAAVASMDTFMAAYGDRHSCDLAALAGARLIIASETEGGRYWDETRIKALTGGDAVTARFMRRNPFTFVPTGKIMIATNEMPNLRNVNDAMRRRIHVVEFPNRPAKADPRLEDELKAEAPGILAWMIKGALDWQRQGLDPPQCVKEAGANYFYEQDVIGRFLAEELVFAPHDENVRTPSAVLWGAWTAFARSNAKPPGRTNDLAAGLEKRGARKCFVQHGVRGWAGVALRASPP